jgi:putative DNA-invertase from lambdoid prophage Rac
MRARGYCRVSTAKQANGGLPLDRQRQQPHRRRRDEGLVEVGVSGTVPLADRPHGQHLRIVSVRPTRSRAYAIA